MKMTTDFALLIRDFMTRYLVATRNVSQNTVLSYRDSYVLLLHCRMSATVLSRKT